MLVAVIGYEVERRWREREGQRCNHRDGPSDAGKGSGGEWQPRGGTQARAGATGERCIPGGEFPSPSVF